MSLTFRKNHRPSYIKFQKVSSSSGRNAGLTFTHFSLKDPNYRTEYGQIIFCVYYNYEFPHFVPEFVCTSKCYTLFQYVYTSHWQYTEILISAYRTKYSPVVNRKSVYLFTIGRVFQSENVPLIKTCFPPPSHLKTVGKTLSFTFVPSETVAERWRVVAVYSSVSCSFA